MEVKWRALQCSPGAPSKRHVGSPPGPPPGPWEVLSPPAAPQRQRAVTGGSSLASEGPRLRAELNWSKPLTFSSSGYGHLHVRGCEGHSVSDPATQQALSDVAHRKQVPRGCETDFTAEHEACSQLRPVWNRGADTWGALVCVSSVCAGQLSP